MPDHAAEHHPSPKERAIGRQREKSEKKAAARSNRKSWFSLTRGRTPNRDHVDHSKPSSPLPPSSFHPISEDRLRPIDFKPNRISTLYVTPSERNLYLAAMSTLDRPPPPLPLWAEAPPNLPPVSTSIYDRFKASPPKPPAPLPDVHPLTTRSMSPKLVKSPELSLNSAGLMVREEFRRLPPPRTSHHALMTLQLPSGIRFSGFGAAALVAVDSAITDTWKQGVMQRSEGVEDLAKRAGEDLKRVASWRVVLRGQAWKRKGSEELESIRLLLAMLTALGLHGWTLQADLQAASSKKDAHNLLFAHAPEHIAPPAYFAVSMPLPDRVSIISAPAKSTPGLISAVRDAITSFADQGHLKSATDNTNATSGTSATTSTERSRSGKGETGNGVKWKSGGNGIKLEGWVHDGVYRFWIDGMRRWFGGGVKKAVYDHLSPQLLIAIISALSSLHYSLVGSIPLLPLQKGRDMLIFSSLPGSGVTHRDTYRQNQTQLPQSIPSSTAGTPVLVSPRESMPSFPNGEPGEADAARRNLPWQSLFTSESKDPTDASIPNSPAIRNTQLTPLTPDQAFAEEAARRRNSSSGSTRPLIPQVSTTPRHRRLLLKKDSLRRRAVSEDATTSNGNREAAQSDDSALQPTEQGAAQLDAPVSHRVTDISRETDETWSLVEPAPRPTPPQSRPAASPEMHERPGSAGRVTTESGDSVYLDADPLAYPEPPKGANAEGQLALGRPMSPHSPPSPSGPGYGATVPEPNAAFGSLPLRRPKSPSRARNAMVDVGDGVGVASMAASVGVTSTLLSAPLASHVGAGPTGNTTGQGKGTEGEEKRRVWDEDEGRWVDMPDHVAPLPVRMRARTISGSSTGRPNGVGSARTRLVIE